MLSGESYDFTDTERAFLTALSYVDNVGNRMSSDTRVLDAPELAGLRSFVSDQLAIYKQRLLRMRDGNEIYLTQSWANVSTRGQFHPKHKHPNSIISGVIYVSEDPGGEQPPIRFHRTTELFPLQLLYDDLNEFNADCREFPVETGRLILFPSLVEHDVLPNSSDGDRISLSFNTFVKGAVGGDSQLTALQFGD